MRSVDLVYAAAIVALFVWLALGATNGFPDLGLGPAGPRTRTAQALAPVSAPGPASPAALATPSSPGSPRVAASATIDTREFEILVGEGPPPWSVAVSVDD
jgi:hypothetical protein